MQLSTKNVLMIIAPENFRDEEYFHTKDSIEKAGINVTTASTSKTAVSSIEKKQVEVDMLIDDVTTDFDGIVFVGGSGAKIYFKNENVLNLARQFNDEGKTVAAICIAPMILALAGVLQHKRATSWEGACDDLKDLGVEFTGDDVTIDGNIITGSGPKASYKFGDAIANALRS